MKKKIAIWLFKLARRLYPISVTVFEQKEILEPTLGTCPYEEFAILYQRECVN